MKKIKSVLETMRIRRELKDIQRPGRTYFFNGHRPTDNTLVCDNGQRILWYEYGRIVE